jgi:SAM-dependent methyltransferase
MNSFLHGLVQAAAETFSLAGPILELGSYQVEGQEELINLRSLFPGRPYVGVDFRGGPGVDVVANVEDLPQDDASVGTVIAMNLFEHVAHFWKGFEEAERVLRADGVLIVACPFYFHIHNFPDDYWRFTPAAFKLLLRNYPNKIVGWHGTKTRPTGVWAIAFRPGRARIRDRDYLHFQARMRHYGKMPLGWVRRLRYQLGSLVCGRRPFAPYLDRDTWGSECLTSPRVAALSRMVA